MDVSIQAQVVNLMQKLQHEQGLTYLFIAHDLSMVKYISDRIGVMHWGKLLEVGPADEIYHNPIHPYYLQFQNQIQKESVSVSI